MVLPSWYGDYDASNRYILMRYKGATPVKKGQKVHLTAYDKEYKVVDTLATQFTVSVNEVTRFFFYDDKGDTWSLKVSE